jgi:mitogen-activated protein kinase 15
MLGKPMFPGVSTLNQIERVLKITGMPSQEDIYDLGSNATKIFATIPPIKKTSLESLFSTASEDAIDLMNRLLKFNPADRLTVEEALEHSYVAQFHNIDNEPICKKIITIPIDDNKKFSIKEYRLKIYSDIHKRKKEIRKKKMLQEQMYYQKKTKQMGYSTQYGAGGSSGYQKENSKETEHHSRPATSSSKGYTSSYKRSSTSKYSSTAGASKYASGTGASKHTSGTGASKNASATDKEKYRKYYHAKTYKM